MKKPKPAADASSGRRKAMLVLGSGGVGAALGVAGTLAVREAKYWIGGGKDMRAGLGTPSSTTLSVPICMLRPKSIEGPYFVDQRLLRADIRSDSASQVAVQGVPFELTLLISQATSANPGGCVALNDVMVDIWHCDAVGRYSAILEQQSVNTDFLRGVQATDASGKVTFRSIYPGWYATRAPHIHVKVRWVSKDNTITREFGTQLYLDEAVTDAVYATAPYSAQGRRDTLNAVDGLYKRGGEQLLLKPEKTPEGGWRASFGIGLDFDGA